MQLMLKMNLMDMRDEATIDGAAAILGKFLKDFEAYAHPDAEKITEGQDSVAICKAMLVDAQQQDDEFNEMLANPSEALRTMLGLTGVLALGEAEYTSGCEDPDCMCNTRPAADAEYTKDGDFTNA